MTKIVTISSSPRGAETEKAADAWVRGAAAGPLKRLTVELEEPVHRRLRVEAARRGITMSALVRNLIEQDCPE